MDKQTAIIKYVHAITGGLITLEHAHADRILAIASTALPQSPYVKMYEHNAAKRAWQLLFTTPATLEDINAKVLEYSTRAEVVECYQYQCYSPGGELLATINTGHAGLF